MPPAILFCLQDGVEGSPRRTLFVLEIPSHMVALTHLHRRPPAR